MNWFSLLSGLVIGFVSSFGVWYVISHLIKPKIEFSERISQVSSLSDMDKKNYRVKFENTGRRAMIDVEVYAKLNIRGLNKLRPNNYEVTYLPISFGGRIPIINPKKSGGKQNLVRIETNKKEEFTRTVYPDDIKQKVESRSLTLEDLLQLGEDAWVHIIVMGFDAFSGARKVFESKGYRSKDIDQSAFKAGTLKTISQHEIVS